MKPLGRLWRIECDECGQICKWIPTDDSEEAAKAHEATHAPASSVWAIAPLPLRVVG